MTRPRALYSQNISSEQNVLCSFKDPFDDRHLRRLTFFNAKIKYLFSIGQDIKYNSTLEDRALKKTTTTTSFISVDT
jgi:hypothetical protein